MSTAHYSYEGKATLKKSEQIPVEIKINDVRFLVPVQIDCEIITNDEKFGQKNMQIDGGIDLARQEASFPSIPVSISDLLKKRVFEFLKETTKIAEDTFQAGEEVYEQADRASTEHDNLFNNMGGF